MTEQDQKEEMAAWRRSASYANNVAWELSESLDRTLAQDAQMLHAAHAAMFFWQLIGTPKNLGHAATLLAHVYALRLQCEPASNYLKIAMENFSSENLEPWESAALHAVRANVAAACRDEVEHRAQYRMAAEAISSLPEKGRILLEATMRVVPAPSTTAYKNSSA